MSLWGVIYNLIVITQGINVNTTNHIHYSINYGISISYNYAEGEVYMQCINGYRGRRLRLLYIMQMPKCMNNLCHGPYVVIHWL